MLCGSLGDMIESLHMVLSFDVSLKFVRVSLRGKDVTLFRFERYSHPIQLGGALSAFLNRVKAWLNRLMMLYGRVILVEMLKSTPNFHSNGWGSFLCDGDRCSAICMFAVRDSSGGFYIYLYPYASDLMYVFVGIRWEKFLLTRVSCTACEQCVPLLCTWNWIFIYLFIYFLTFLCANSFPFRCSLINYFK